MPEARTLSLSSSVYECGALSSLTSSLIHLGIAASLLSLFPVNILSLQRIKTCAVATFLCRKEDPECFHLTFYCKSGAYGRPRHWFSTSTLVGPDGELGNREPGIHGPWPLSLWTRAVSETGESTSGPRLQRECYQINVENNILG